VCGVAYKTRGRGIRGAAVELKKRGFGPIRWKWRAANEGVRLQYPMNKLRKLALGLLGGVLLGVSALAFNGDALNYGCKYGQCQAIAKSTGQQCKHCVSNAGDAYCYQHKR
jgi:hypothetical protein